MPEDDTGQLVFYDGSTCVLSVPASLSQNKSSFSQSLLDLLYFTSSNSYVICNRENKISKTQMNFLNVLC